MADQVREAFEAWFEADALPLEHSNWFRLDTDGDYQLDYVGWVWKGWQAHAAEVEALRSALIAARDHIACSVCHHDETQRRGLIWTECLQCGGMFADDQGGVPAPKEPAVLALIRAALKGDKP